MYWKLSNGNYVNGNSIYSIYVTGSGSTWNIEVSGDDSLVGAQLNAGPFTSEAEAQAFIKQLTQGFDPADLV